MSNTTSGSATLNADVEIGAVEIKNASDDTRGEVGALTDLTSASNGLPVASYPIASEIHVGEIGGKSVVINSSFTRPSDTTTYAAGEVVGPTAGATVMTFTNCARANAGSGVITHATLVDGANVATKGSFELWLFDTTFTPDADNAVFTPTDAELLTCIGVIPMTLSYVGDATSGINGNAVYMGTIDRPIPFVCGASSRNLFGTIVVRNAYVPVSAETFDVRLFVDQN